MKIAETHALWPALCSAACGGAARRCAAPSPAAAALRAAPPGRYTVHAPNALRAQAHPFTNTGTPKSPVEKARRSFYVIFCVRHGLPHKVRPNSDGARTQDQNCCGDPHTIDHKRSRQPGHAFLPCAWRLRWPISPLPSPPRIPHAIALICSKACCCCCCMGADVLGTEVRWPPHTNCGLRDRQSP